MTSCQGHNEKNSIVGWKETNFKILHNLLPFEILSHDNSV